MDSGKITSILSKVIPLNCNSTARMSKYEKCENDELRRQ